MASNGGVKITGLREVVRGLEKAGVEVADLKDAFAAIAVEGSGIASGAVRSKSGKLRGSVRGNRAKAKAVIAAGRSTVPYAGAQNYGWARRNIRPQGFMQKADLAMQSRAPRLLEVGINDAIRRSGL